MEFYNICIQSKIRYLLIHLVLNNHLKRVFMADIEIETLPKEFFNCKKMPI